MKTILNPQREKTEKIATQLLVYKARYYSGEESVPDAVYDALEDELRGLDPEHPVLDRVGSDAGVPESAAKKVAHEPAMLSLAKSYEVKDLLAFVEKMERVCVTDKLDGMALALEYDVSGRFFRASTRGNGRLGENVTEHVLHMSSVPKNLPVLENEGMPVSLEVRGEVFFPLEVFQQHADRFESFRNAVPGTFGRKEITEVAELIDGFAFCAYDVVLRLQNGELVSANRTHQALNATSPTHYGKLERLEQLGFWTGVQAGFTLTVTAQELLRVSDSAAHLSQLVSEWFERSRPYAIDGLVFRCDDEQEWSRLGATAHHPRGSLAFKQAGAEAVTELVDIKMGVGRSGKISFRAQLVPVSLSGATISFATLHNAEFIEVGGYAPGARVKIKRSGEVIPYIIGVEQAAAAHYDLPEKCLCGSPLTRQGPDLFCLDNPTCPYKDSEAMLHFVRSLEIYGVSEKLLERFRQAGLLEKPSDLFQIREEDLLALDGFKEKLAKNVVQSISEKRHLPLSVFLTALGLKRGGKVKCEEVAGAFRTLERVRQLSAEELGERKGWAEKSAADFVDSLEKKSRLIDELLEHIKVEDLPEDASGNNLGGPEEGGFAGLKFCITGSLSKSRSFYEELIRSLGGQVMSSVSGSTSFLVCNAESSSSKYKKALKLGVPVITEEELLSRAEAAGAAVDDPAP